MINYKFMTYSGPCHTSNMTHFVKIFNGFSLRSDTGFLSHLSHHSFHNRIPSFHICKKNFVQVAQEIWRKSLKVEGVFLFIHVHFFHASSFFRTHHVRKCHEYEMCMLPCFMLAPTLHHLHHPI